MRRVQGIFHIFLSVGFAVISMNLIQPPPSQAADKSLGIKNILKAIFPPCGIGTRGERFVVKGDQVCDNTTGLWWQRTPGMAGSIASPCDNGENCFWEEARDYCANFSINGKKKKKEWRLPEVKELVSLQDYSVANQAMTLNEGSFEGVQEIRYWSSEEILSTTDSAWVVFFGSGGVGPGNFRFEFFAWCVSEGKKGLFKK